jgi:hypothetical protein
MMICNYVWDAAEGVMAMRNGASVQKRVEQK